MRGLSLLAAWAALLAGCLVVWRGIIVLALWLLATLPLQS